MSRACSAAGPLGYQSPIFAIRNENPPGAPHQPLVVSPAAMARYSA